MSKQYNVKSEEDLKELMAKGKTGAQIAEICKVSIPTVANYKKRFGLSKSRGGSLARPNATVRKPVTAKGSDAVKQLRGLLDMYETLPGGTEGSQNIRSAIRADMVDLVRSL